MSGDHNQYQKNLSYLDFECPRCGHCCYVDADDISQDNVDETVKCRHEPVAWMHNFIEGNVITHIPADIGRHPERWTPLYTAPPKKQWVGLTGKDIDDCYFAARTPDFDLWDFASEIDDLLREKNQ